MVEIVDHVGWGERREGKVIVDSVINYTLYEQDPRRMSYLCYRWHKKWVRFYVKWLMIGRLRDMIMYAMERYEEWDRRKLAFKVLVNDAVMVLYDWVSRDEDCRFASVDIWYSVGLVTLTTQMKCDGHWYGRRNVMHIASLVDDYKSERWVDYIKMDLKKLEQATIQGWT